MESVFSKIKSAFQSKSDPTVKFPDMASMLKTLKKLQSPPQKFDLVSYDLIPNEDPDKEIVHKKLTGEEIFASTKEEKSLSSFIGSVIGNALGIYTEGYDLIYERKLIKDFESLPQEVIQHRCGPGHYTAGTSLALCIADSILHNKFVYNGKDIRYRFLLWHYCGYNNGKNVEPNPILKVSVGAGKTIEKAIDEFIKNPTDRVETYGKKDNENGNGSIIRLAPIPIAYSNNLSDCLSFAEKQSSTTHNGIEAAECCRLLCFVVYNFLNIESVGECKAFLEQIGESFHTECKSVDFLAKSQQEDEKTFEAHKGDFNSTVTDRNWNWKDPNFKYSACRVELGKGLIGMYCMDATAMALHVIYHSESFQEAITRAINLGGDSVSLGTIVGQLAGAMFGYDMNMKNWYTNFVLKWDEGKCAVRAYKLLKHSEEETPTNQGTKK